MSTAGRRARGMRAGHLAVLFGVLSLLVLRTGVPLYDGVGFPDEPYRYVNPPHGYQQKHEPTAAQAVLRMSKGSNAGDGLISSAESGPQVIVYIPTGGLRVSDAATTVTVRARPVAATSPPTDGTLNSNVYTVDFEGHAARVDAGDSSPPNITLREATFETVLAVMEYRAGTSGPWRRLETGQVGRDIYLSALQGAGEYVLVQPAVGTPRASRDTGGGKQVLWIVGFCVLVVIALLFAVRRTSGHREPADPT